LRIIRAAVKINAVNHNHVERDVPWHFRRSFLEKWGQAKLFDEKVWTNSVECDIIKA